MWQGEVKEFVEELNIYLFIYLFSNNAAYS